MDQKRGDGEGGLSNRLGIKPSSANVHTVQIHPTFLLYPDVSL